jgi:hypothetical protein
VDRSAIQFRQYFLSGLLDPNKVGQNLRWKTTAGAG